MPPKTRHITGAEIVADARRYFGVPYQYGGTNRQSGLDCSGLVLVVCNDLGITSCPRTSEEQWAWVTRIDANQVGPGDLVFLVGAEIDPPPGHVGIVVAPGKFIDAPFTGAVVREDDYSLNATGVNRVIGFGRIPDVRASVSANRATAPSGGGSLDEQGAGAAVGSLVAWVVIAAMFVVIIGALALVAVFLVH